MADPAEEPGRMVDLLVAEGVSADQILDGRCRKKLPPSSILLVIDSGD